VALSPDNRTEKLSTKKPNTKKLKLKSQTTTTSNDSPNDEVHITSAAEKSPKSHKPDIFTTVLNEKKRSLMQDPEVVEFFNKLYQAKQQPD
jgi:Regulatory factor X-associated C-terminal binding domain